MERTPLRRSRLRSNLCPATWGQTLKRSRRPAPINTVRELDGGSSLVGLTGLWPLLSPLAGQKRPPILPGGRFLLSAIPEGSIIPSDCRRRRLCRPELNGDHARIVENLGWDRASPFAGRSPLFAWGFKAHAGVKSIDRHAAAPLGQPHCSFAFARAGLRRTPRPSASNSIPALSSAAWIARSVEPFASVPFSMLFIAVVEIPACAASCAWVKRAIARPARIWSIVIMVPFCNVIINYQEQLT